MSTSGGSGGGSLTSISGQLTAAQISTLFSAPVEIIPTPGANRAITVLGVVWETVAGNSFWLATNAGLFYADDVGTPNTVADGLADMFLLNEGSLLSELLANRPPAGLTIDTPSGQNQPIVIARPALNPVRSSTIVTVAKAVGGAGYVIGDTGTIDNSNLAPDAGYIVDTVDGGGAVLTFHLGANTGLYDVTHNPHATSTGGAQPGIGIGFTVNVTAIAVATGSLYYTVYYQTVTTH